MLVYDKLFPFLKFKFNILFVYLGFLLLGGKDQKLGSGMHNFQLFNDSGSVAGYEKLFQVVDNHLVASFQSKGIKKVCGMPVNGGAFFLSI